MEPLYPLGHLLKKFSHSSNILKFYGNYGKAKALMRSLCKDTMHTWDKNKDAYLLCVMTSKGYLKYHGDFDESIKQYLLSDFHYVEYNLHLIIRTQQAIKLFGEFLEEVNFKNLLYIKQLLVYRSEAVTNKPINELYFTIRNYGLDASNFWVIDDLDDFYYPEEDIMLEYNKNDMYTKERSFSNTKFLGIAHMTHQGGFNHNLKGNYAAKLVSILKNYAQVDQIYVDLDSYTNIILADDDWSDFADKIINVRFYLNYDDRNKIDFSHTSKSCFGIEYVYPIGYSTMKLSEYIETFLKEGDSLINPRRFDHFEKQYIQYHVKPYENITRFEDIQVFIVKSINEFPQSGYISFEARELVISTLSWITQLKEGIVTKDFICLPDKYERPEVVGCHNFGEQNPDPIFDLIKEKADLFETGGSWLIIENKNITTLGLNLEGANLDSGKDISIEINRLKEDEVAKYIDFANTRPERGRIHVQADFLYRVDNKNMIKLIEILNTNPDELTLRIDYVQYNHYNRELKKRLCDRLLSLDSLNKIRVQEGHVTDIEYARTTYESEELFKRVIKYAILGTKRPSVGPYLEVY